MNNFTIPVEDMSKHINHKLTITPNGKAFVLECQTCYEDVAKVEAANLVKPAEIPVPEIGNACNMDEGCEACGS